MHDCVSLVIPKFSRFGIITANDLNLINSNFIDYVSVNYERSSDGIITGFDINYNKDHIRVGKGLIKINGEILWFNKDVEIPLPKYEGRYHLIISYEIVELEDKKSYTLDFKYIEQSNYNDEFIIFSIILREGAIITDESNLFDEYRNEFNTIDIIQQKYSVASSRYYTLSPILTKKWAYLLSKKEKLKPEDLNFIFFCLNSIISREIIVAYLNIKNIEASIEMDNRQLVQKLSKVVNGYNDRVEKDVSKTFDKFYIQQ